LIIVNLTRICHRDHTTIRVVENFAVTQSLVRIYTVEQGVSISL